MKNVINIGITINFDKNFVSNGLQQNIIFLNNLFNQMDDTCCYLLWQGSKINEKIVNKKWYKYLFFETKIIESIKIDMHAACLTGPIPTTIK